MGDSDECVRFLRVGGPRCTHRRRGSRLRARIEARGPDRTAGDALVAPLYRQSGAHLVSQRALQAPRQRCSQWISSVHAADALGRMDLQCGGMELASEIVVKAAGANLSIAEVPITYHPRVGESKLNSIRDSVPPHPFLVALVAGIPVSDTGLPARLLAGLVQLRSSGCRGAWRPWWPSPSWPSHSS